MNRINIVGAGPSGLYFAILIREIYPTAEINIFERNAREDVEGWGIVINMATINLLKKNDPLSHELLLKSAKQWSDIDIVHRNEAISVRGREFMSIPRNILISTLQERCESLEIPINYLHKIKLIEEIKNCDLLVGADGAYSTVRSQLSEHFIPELDERPDYFIWLGTTRQFKTITHIFKQTEAGTFCAECYPYSDTHSTFIVICNPETWKKANFADFSMETSIQLLETIFRDELKDEKLLTGNSARWRKFPLVKNGNWFHPKVLLLGDALHTAHFSIGSGTRLALEDSIVAANAFTRHDSIESSLLEFQENRRPYIEKYQKVAYDSLVWFENIDDVINLELIPFTYELMTRSDKLGIRSLKLQDPEFVRIYTDWQNAQLQ